MLFIKNSEVKNKLTTVKENTGTQFNWKPLIEIPDAVPSVTFWEGDDAEARFEEFNETAQENYGEAAKNVRVLTYDAKNKLVKGMNVFAGVHADVLFKPEGIRVATMAELEKALQTGALKLKGTYEDSGLVLRDERDPNGYLAQNLAEQVKARGIKVGKVPYVIPLRGLEVVRDEDSNYGLAFQLTDESQVIEAPQLAGKNSGKRFKTLDEDGMPVFDQDGERVLYTNDSGLSGLSLSGDLGVYSDWSSLAGSVGNGRVVLSRGETSSNNFTAQYIAEVNRAYDEQKGELDAKRDRALAVLGGE